MHHSPLELQIALWYHCRVGPYMSQEDPLHANSAGTKEAKQRFAEAGLLMRDGSDFKATDGLHLYIEAICATPWPEKRWMIPPPSIQLVYKEAMEADQRRHAAGDDADAA